MARPSTDLNLRSLHVDGGKKRSRKDRKKPDPPENLKAGEAEARAFTDTLPLMPGVIVEDRKDYWDMQAPHNDDELWWLQLVEAFGTRSTALIRTFLRQLASLCPQDWDADRQQWKTNETAWNAVLALVADWRPENSAQAALAAQMAATHIMTMKLSSQALNSGHTIYHGDAALASKLARTFAEQCKAMQALKGKTRTAKQSIHVTKETHQHVHYHDERGGGKNANQSHGRGGTAKTDDFCEAVWSEEPGGKALPCASREGEGSVPLSRRKSGSAKG